MQKVNRESLLNQLESVQPGLSPREVVEQSSCFVFKDGRVMTYNDEVSCSIDCDAKITGAVPAAPLISVLQKMQEETIDIEEKEGELLITGKRRKAGLVLENEILLPVDKVEVPKKWIPLHDNFIEGIRLANQVTSKNDSFFELCCVHIHPNWVEASDNFQVARMEMETGVTKEMLVRRESLVRVISSEMSHLSQTSSWLHFKNPAGLVLSCRKYDETFPDLTKILKVEGDSVTLPKGLGDAADRASIFSSDTSEDNQVLVELRPGKLRIKGSGAHGWFQEMKGIKYKGGALAFLIAPELLIEITKNYNDCIITKDRLMVDGGRFKYVTCLGVPE